MEDYIPNKKEYHPQMHSAEHILNQTMNRMFNCGRAVSAHIEKKKSKCDYQFNRALSLEEIAEVEARVNSVIQANLSVTESFLTREEAARQFTLTRLPEDSGDRIRVITIGDYDACPCSGVHIANTKEIGRFSIVSTELREGGTLRVRFKLSD